MEDKTAVTVEPAPDPSVLIVDDNEDHLGLVERFVASSRCRAVRAATGQEALDRLARDRFDVVVTDMVMPDKSGMEVLLFVRANCPETDVIVMTGYSKEYSYMAVVQAGAADFINKPFQRDEFSAKLQRVLAERRLRGALRQEIQVRRRTEQELLKVKNLAEAASLAKSEFINTMSHELRTPMNGIMGFTEILRDSGLSADQRQYLDFIAASSNRLLLMINRILDYAELMAKQPQRERVCFSPRQLCAKVAGELRGLARSKEIGLTCELDEAIAERLVGDDAVLAQLLSSLMENALLYSEAGEVCLKVARQAGADPAKIILLFSLSDMGPGIPAGAHEFIFEPFTQLQNSMIRDHEGAGLGLALCKRYVELLHGEIWLESEVGAGTTFYFTAEFETQEAQSLRAL